MRLTRTPLTIVLLVACGATAGLRAADAPVLDEITIWGQQDRSSASPAHPRSLLKQKDFASINSTTTEDLVKYEPSLVIRKRFIGDSNGTLGMRGANMFQTSRSMVFADGVPLHYLLQTRWNGAPRWTLISASEIAQIEVLYGPFSAEYGGNSMGGVVLMESAIPRQREIHIDTSLFTQDFAAYGFDDSVQGYKTFVSWGDLIGNTSVFVSYNHLDSASHPQTFYFGGSSTANAPTSATGALPGNDERGTARLWFGDTGIVENRTDNFKLKLGHTFGEWQTLLNVAFEDRLADTNSPNSYLRDNAGNVVWSGHFRQDGLRFSVPAARLGTSTLQRDSLSTGLRLRGPLSEQLSLEANLNHFVVLRDETRSSLANPADPAYNGKGEVMDFGDTGWHAAEVKLRAEDFLVPGMSLITGVRQDAYELNLDVFASRNHRLGDFDHFTNRSGGQTRLNAVFAQLQWPLPQQWELGLGLRWEQFQSNNGYFSRDRAATPEFDLVAVPATRDTAFSPKFSLGWKPLPEWRVAYAFGTAYRFPIVEELFSQYAAYNALSIANPALRPEHGLHHNVTVERTLERGTLQVNLFQERVRDTIEAQSEQLPGGLSVRTFIPVGLIETKGVELIANLDGVGVAALDLRANLVWTDATIVRNAPDPALEGNTYPRMPEWRGNLLATYHVTQTWDIGLTLQYAADSFGRNDNLDHEQQVYGAQDGYTFAGAKSTLRLQNGLSVGLGIDNIFDRLAFVAHPWPGRTWYANLAYDF